MTKVFTSRLEAINWLADYAENEAQFEVLREELQFNYIYSGIFYVDIDKNEQPAEVVWLTRDRKN